MYTPCQILRECINILYVCLDNGYFFKVQNKQHTRQIRCIQLHKHTWLLFLLLTTTIHLCTHCTLFIYIYIYIYIYSLLTPSAGLKYLKLHPPCKLPALARAHVYMPTATRTIPFGLGQVLALPFLCPPNCHGYTGYTIYHNPCICR